MDLKRITVVAALCVSMAGGVGLGAAGAEPMRQVPRIPIPDMPFPRILRPPHWVPRPVPIPRTVLEVEHTIASRADDLRTHMTPAAPRTSDFAERLTEAGEDAFVGAVCAELADPPDERTLEWTDAQEMTKSVITKLAVSYGAPLLRNAVDWYSWQQGVVDDFAKLNGSFVTDPAQVNVFRVRYCYRPPIR